MSGDTKAIIGSIVGTGLVAAGLLSAQMAGQSAAVNARFDDMAARMDRVETRLDGVDTRLRNVEIAFGKVDQRLETLERAILPAASPPAN